MIRDFYTKGDAGYQIHISMDEPSYVLLIHIVRKLEADFGEVIRRALQAYEFCEPSDGRGDSINGVEFQGECFKTIHIRIPPNTKKILDREKNSSGDTYAHIISQALRVFSQLLRNRDSINVRHFDERSPMEDVDLLALTV